MMKKYTLWILLLVAGVVLLAGCSGGNQSAFSKQRNHFLSRFGPSAQSKRDALLPGGVPVYFLS